MKLYAALHTDMNIYHLFNQWIFFAQMIRKCYLFPNILSTWYSLVSLNITTLKYSNHNKNKFLLCFIDII